MKVDYSPREKRIIATQQFKGTEWVTNETPSRRVRIVGRSWMDPDVAVVEIPGESCQKRWLMACGSSYDGKIIGTDIWIREA